MRTLIRFYRVVAALLPVAPAFGGLNEALRYLEQEVPRWERENGCFSCHNNGDGARALMLARSLGFRVNDVAVRDTLGWLERPASWEPKALARVQFATTVLTAIETGALLDRKPLLEAAELLAADQSGDGSWQVEAPGTLGSATTYGPYLATYLAGRALREADARRYAEAIGKADRWLRARSPENPLDAGAHFLATRSKASLDLLLRTQTASGSWLNEPFDTAIALWALSTADRTPDIADRIARARAWLLLKQYPEGGWPGTTRPAGGSSYAQHISTSAWAAAALARTQRPH
jgi:hypothetical protein